MGIPNLTYPTSQERIADLYRKFQASAEKMAAKKAAKELKKQLPPIQKTSPTEAEVKAVQSAVKRAERISANNIAQSNTLETAARVHEQNRFLKESQVQLTIAQNAYKNVLQQNFVHAQLHAQAKAHVAVQLQARTNMLLQEAKNQDLLQKARLCQANAYAEKEEDKKSFKESVESVEKDIAAETLCQLRGK